MKRFLLLCALALAAACSPANIDTAHRVRSTPWDPAVVDAFARLPVQEGGRVKPLETVAQYALLAVNGNRSLRVVWRDGKKESLSATEWLLDCFFYPEQARHYRCIRVDNDEAITTIGLRVPGRKRLDRYSYAEIVPAAGRLMELARQYQKIESKNRTPVQGQIVDLANALLQVDHLLVAMDFARQKIDVHRTELLAKMLPGEAQRPVSYVLRNLAKLGMFSSVASSDEIPGDAEAKQRERDAIAGILHDFERAVGAASGTAWFPPAGADEEVWRDLPSLAADTMAGAPLPEAAVTFVECMERIAAARAGSPDSKARAEEALQGMRAAATARGEYAKVGTEVTYHRGQFVYRALTVYGIAFVLAAFSWLLPRSRLIARSVTVTVVAALALLVTGITLRCMIMSRAPVATLYETFLLITAVGTVVGLIVEAINRQRVGITLAAFIGGAGLLLARWFEELEGQDTLRMLPAVLNTNFWLSTHVTTITMGYSAGLMAALFAHVWVFAKLFSPARVALLRSVSRMIYGTICFALVFSVVGTILGGIWANDSWGRFWGWDPKENGALLICLVNIATLHGRLAGWLRDRGMALAAIFGGVVVAFSWFHVNQLGVGLHSYGFTEGILTALTIFYVSQAIVFALGLVVPDTRVAPAPAPAASPRPGSELAPAK